MTENPTTASGNGGRFKPLVLMAGMGIGVALGGTAADLLIGASPETAALQLGGVVVLACALFMKLLEVSR